MESLSLTSIGLGLIIIGVGIGIGRTAGSAMEAMGRSYNFV